MIIENVKITFSGAGEYWLCAPGIEGWSLGQCDSADDVKAAIADVAENGVPADFDWTGWSAGISVQEERGRNA